MNRLLIVLLTPIFTISCGGGGGDTGASDNELNNQQENQSSGVLDVPKWGFVDIHDSAGIYSNSLAVFNRNTSDADKIYRDSIVGPQPVHDTCIVEENVADPSDTISYVNINAGDKVSLFLGETVFHELPRFQFQDSLIYTEQSPASDIQVPNGLRVAYAGDEFPVIEGLISPDIDSLTSVSHCDKSGLDPRTVFTWQPGSESGAYIVISAQATSSVFSPDRLVNCFAKDDGQFSIPESSLAELLDTDLLGIYSFQRMTRSVYSGSQAAIAVRRLSNACVD